jgi:hypothetical protein
MYLNFKKCQFKVFIFQFFFFKILIVRQIFLLNPVKILKINPLLRTCKFYFIFIIVIIIIFFFKKAKLPQHAF